MRFLVFAIIIHAGAILVGAGAIADSINSYNPLGEIICCLGFLAGLIGTGGLLYSILWRKVRGLD